MTSSNPEIEELNRKIGVLIALAAAQVGTTLPLAERAPLLNRLGLGRVEIARVCGTTPQIVSVRLSEGKRKRGQPRLPARRIQDERTDG